MRGRCGKLLLTTTAWVTLGFQPAWTNPLGGQVVGGGATIQGQGTAKVTVTQTTDKAIINWNTFNIGAGEQTQFIQPSSSAIALNRVTGGLGPSQLYGTLTANGRIFLVNPDGILVGPGARIDTAGFLATTSDIRNEDFLAGRYNFFIPGRPDASVVNLGAITASGHGFAALVAPGVRNSGTITATLGKISLASGNVFALDFYGDSLIKLAVNDAVAAQVKDVASGQTLRSLISNDGKLSANGGRVQLSAATARQIVDSVINTSGVIEANTIGTQNGKIVLMSQTAATKLAGAPAQTVKVSGLLSAAGPNAGETGGTILITGENVVLANARLNASGDAGGGKVLIGGDWGGGAPPTSVLNASARLETNLIPTATNVNVDANTVIDASALQIGDGGKVIVWADGATNFAGTILARGGLLTGNGGFVETSGHALNVDGARVDTSAPNGNTGTWLLDPFNLLIDAAAAVAIANGLSASNLIVQTTVTGTSGPGNASAGDGDITVAADISWNSGNSLTLSAYRNIIVNANVINTGGAAVTLRADNTGTGVGTVSFGAGKSISTAGAVSIFYNPAGNDNNSVNAFSYTVPTDFSANIVGGGTLTAYMLVNTVYDLQNIQNNLSGSYALGRDIDASATASWNAGAGFLPIGSSASRFRGVFDGGSADGQRHFIGGLTINSAARDVGLFGFTESTAIIRKLDLINVSVSSNFDSTLGSGSVGGLVGFNRGSIAEVAVTGNVSASAGTINFFKSVGGLVGQNFGTITASNSFGTVSGNEFASVGGLVGRNPGIITNSSSESAVSSPRGPANVGGLVGNNIGQILDSHASGAVSGTGTFVSATPFTGSVGGLVGWNGQNSGNAAIISNSYASGDVNGYGTSVALVNTTLGVGGLVGFNHTTGRIENSHATGAVTSVNSTATGAQAILQSFLPFTGGLVGWNGGTISDSYANGSINVTGALVNTAIIGGPLNGSPAGGLVGINLDTGQIIRSYATGSIVGTNLVFGGGLVGANDGTISVAYATGNVTLTAGVDQSRVGGFAGRVAGTVDRAYALGNVTADFIGMTGFAGGFAGSNRGLISQSYSMGSVTAGG
ncbi:MAG TPA: GLUG motif-containing protein, partial [Xanthobacteraceae bacterium]|nr:GLUG motif-containing protein [Xanthobacteraceae bacterium]